MKNNKTFRKPVGRLCLTLFLILGTTMVNASSWWQPEPGLRWQIQLQDEIDTSFNVDAYDVDMVETPQAVIDALHDRGIKVICYFDAGSFEVWRTDADQFPASVIGKRMAGWPGERWLDIRQIDLLAPIMEARMDLAHEKRCDAVDPDNVDGYTNKTGFPLTKEDQLIYSRWLAQQAHARGMAAGLKNGLGQIEDLVTDFDFVVNEQCQQYKECDLLTPFITANKPVLGIEYKGRRGNICADANARNFDTLVKKRNLKARRYSCR